MKRFVLNPGPFIIASMIAFLFLFSNVKSFAATKTWNGGSGGSYNWSTGTNWMGNVAPVNGDDVVFNTAGTITFTTMPAGAVNYNSLTISAGTVILGYTVGTSTLTIGSVSINPTLLVSGATSLTIGTNVDIILATNATAKIDGTFTVNSGRSYNTNGTGVGTTVFGVISNAGTITSAITKLNIGFNGVYTHNQNGGVIPDATWNTNSFCIITGITNKTE